jgi:thiol-disulfide isomerase/thioredoxin
MMKRFSGVLLLFALLIGGLAIWQTINPELAMDRGDQLTNTNMVSIGRQSFENSQLAASRSEMRSFRTFPFDFESQTIEGKSLRKQDFTGRVLIVDIWATWCPPCRGEIPSFVSLQSKYQDAGLSIVGMNFERTATPRDAILAIEEFRRGQPINYPLVLGEEPVRKQVPHFSGYPTTLFIDGKGMVRMTLVGAHPFETLEAYSLILLSELDAPAPIPTGARVKPPLPTAIKPGMGSGATPQANPYAMSVGI